MSVSLPFYDLSQKLILLVEPNESIRRKVYAAFHQANLRLLTVATGVEALDVIHGLVIPTLAMVEINLPDMNGSELASTLAHRYHIPLILTAYHAEPSTVAELLDHSAEDFVYKPFDERELLARAIRLLTRPLYRSANADSYALGLKQLPNSHNNNRKARKAFLRRNTSMIRLDPAISIA